MSWSKTKYQVALSCVGVSDLFCLDVGGSVEVKNTRWIALERNLGGHVLRVF